MKKGKTYTEKKKTQKGTKKISINLIIIILSLIPVVFSSLFQGGYFPWETYLTFLLALPSIFLFIIAKFKPENQIRKSGADIGLFAFLLVAFLSLFFTVYFHATLTEFFKVLIYLALFYIVLNTIEGEKQVNIILNSFLGLSFLLSILGIIAYIAYRFNLKGGIFDFVLKYGFVQGDRVCSTLQYSNTFAAFITLPFFIAVSYFLSNKSIAKKILYLLLSLIFLLSFVLAQSRGGFVAFAIALVIFVLLLRGRERKFTLFSFAFLVLGILLFLLIRKDFFLPVFNSFISRLKVMFSFLRGQWEKSLGVRVYMLKDSLCILKDYPVFGTGNGTYQYVYAKYRTIYFFSKFPHSIFFQVLDELGIIGSIAFVYMIFSLFKIGFKVIKENYSAVSVGIYAGLFAVLLHALVDFDWSLMFMPLIFFYMFAVIISGGNKEYFVLKCPIIEKFKLRKRPVKNLKTVDSSKALMKRIRIASIIVTSILLLIFIFQFIGASFNSRAKGSIGLVPWQNTVSMYKTAIAFDTLSAEYHYDLANFNFTYLVPAASDPTQFIQEATTHYLAAIKHCPTFFLYHFELGKLYMQTKNEKGIEELSKAVENNPLDAGGHAALALAYLNLKQNTVMAKVQIEEALKLDPNNSDAIFAMASLYEQLGETDKALETYQNIINKSPQNAYARYRVGLLYEKQGMLPEAINNFFYAVKYNSKLTEAKSEFEKYAPTITFLKPQSNENLKIGSTYEISWLPSNENNVEWYDIYLVPSQGEPILIKENLSLDSIINNWTVSSDFQPGTYKLIVYAMAPKLMQGKFDNWISNEEVQINIVD